MTSLARTVCAISMICREFGRVGDALRVTSDEPRVVDVTRGRLAPAASLRQEHAKIMV